MTTPKAPDNRKRKPLHNNDDSIVHERIERLMSIDNSGSGLIVKTALLSGLRGGEMIYAFCEEVCDNPSCGIGCKKLHVINKRNGLSIIAINWIQSEVKRCYFTMLPTMLWQQFRNLPVLNEIDVKPADKVVSKVARVKFSDIRSIFHRAMAAEMNAEELDILAGSASPSAARNCLMLEADKMVRAYVLAWERAGVVLPVL